MSPTLQQSVRLLQLSSLEFVQSMATLLDANPFVDRDEGIDTAELPEPADDHDDADSWLDDLPRPSVGDTLSPIDLTPVRVSLAAHLHQQIDVLGLGHRDTVLAKVVIESLDDDGFLRTALADLGPITPLDVLPDDDELRIALRRVQALEPAGVAARSVSECLGLQLRDTPDAVLREIVDHHLDLLATHGPPAVARLLRVPLADVHDAVTRLRRLDPRPAARFSSERTSYIVPDVVVTRGRTGWRAGLNTAAIPRYQLNERYAAIVRGDRSLAGSPLTESLREATWAVQTVRRRFDTILDVARVIVRRQAAYFDLGPMAIKPLSLKDVAEELGMHESTVSRSTNNKYMRTPFGTVELSYFFARARLSSGGTFFCGTAVRELVAEMIRTERGQAPVSDAEVARRLAKQGLVMTRRVITKYRQQLGIETAEERLRRHRAEAETA